MKAHAKGMLSSLIWSVIVEVNQARTGEKVGLETEGSVCKSQEDERDVIDVILYEK